jgi:hypothetical protein
MNNPRKSSRDKPERAKAQNGKSANGKKTNGKKESKQKTVAAEIGGVGVREEAASPPPSAPRPSAQAAAKPAQPAPKPAAAKPAPSAARPAQPAAKPAPPAARPAQPAAKPAPSATGPAQPAAKPAPPATTPAPTAIEKASVASKPAATETPKVPQPLPENAVDTIERSLRAAGQGTVAVNCKLLDFARANVNSGFDHAKDLAAARSPLRIMRLQMEYWHDCLETFASQALELRALSVELVANANNPLREHMRRRLKATAA